VAKAKAKDLPAGVPPEGGAPTAPEGLKPPPHGTPRPLAPGDVAGDLPRVCNQLDRVPAGGPAKRFKCRVINHDNFRATKYVLALDAASAKQCHTQAIGLDAYLQSLRDAGALAAEVPDPQVVCTALPD
jgi:hypothetical protein